MDAKAVTIPAEKIRSNTEQWLLKQAAPALGLILADAPDNAFLNEFISAAIARRDKIIAMRLQSDTLFDNDEISA